MGGFRMLCSEPAGADGSPAILGGHPDNTAFSCHGDIHGITGIWRAPAVRYPPSSTPEDTDCGWLTSITQCRQNS